MRMKSLVLIFIALGCGLVASIGISQVMSKNTGGGASVEMEAILVTTKEIDINSSFDAQNVKLEPWPKMKMPEGAIRSLEEVKDKFARIRFIKGEPILLDKLTDTKGNLTGSIPPGFRVMSVKVDEADVMRGIAPGDKVDVNLYVKRSEEISEPGTYTIMQAVRVFSVGSKVEKDIDPKGQESQFRTISLLVTPEQVRDLAGAVQIGKLSFTLRNQNEPINDETGVTKLNDILKGTTVDSGEAEVASTPHVTPAPAPAAPAGPSLLDMFKDAMKAAGNAKPPAEAEPQTGYTMHIYTPNEVKQFQWQTREGTPQESTVFSAAGSSGGSAPPAVAPAARRRAPGRPGAASRRRRRAGRFRPGRRGAPRAGRRAR